MHLIDLLKVDREVFFAFNQCCKYCFHTNHLMTELKLRTEGIKERIDNRERRNFIVPLFSFSLNSLSFKIALYLKFSNFGLKFSGASLWNLLFLVYLLSIYIINKGPSKPLRENKFSKGNPKNLHYQFSILLFESRFKHTFQEQTKHTFIFIDYMCLWRSSMNAPKKEQNPV